MATAIPAVYYRGGTSKAVFFHEKDIPQAGPGRDRFVKRVMGSPDPMQIDGMGGTHIVTSKIAIITPSQREGVDIDYTFTQVGISDDVVSYSANCGNISSAVGPFAISERLVTTCRQGNSMVAGLETQEVRIFNTGTQKMLVAHVPIDSITGDVIEEGDFAITGVPGTAAPILMDYSHTLGASCNRGLLPTGNVQDTITIGGRSVNVTICDVANLIVVVDAAVTDLNCTESADEITNNDIVIATIKEVRGKAAQILGMCKDWRLVDEQAPMLPMVMLVAPALEDGGADISARLILDNRCHSSMAGTGSMCLAACSRVKGSVANQKLRTGAVDREVLNISHPVGTMPVSVVTDDASKAGNVTFRTLSFVRTARKIMKGEIYVPKAYGIPTRSSVGHLQEEESPISNVPVTLKYAEFIANTRYEDLTVEVLDKLKELLLDNVGISARAATIGESSSAFTSALRTLEEAHGKSTVLAKGQNWGIETAALLNAAFAHTFDFDDTFAAGASHPGAALIATAFAQGEAMNASGKDVLTALAVGYEISTRLARALGTGGYARGFHNTSTTGVFGAVAVLAKLRGLPADKIESSFGFAGSKAAGSMQFLDNGSWNKRLHPGFAARDAFLCIALADAEVRGSTRSIEGKYGFLQGYSAASQSAGLIDGLGCEWVFMSTALKPFPACRMTHTALELAADMAATKKGPIESMEVHLSPSCWEIVGKPNSNKRHPLTIVDAQFSCYFQVANAWLNGSWTGWDAYQNIAEPAVKELSEKIHCISDTGIPDLGVRLQVKWEDGTRKTTELKDPLGEESRPFSKENILAKFKSLAVPVYGEPKASRIMATIDNLEDYTVSELLWYLQ